MAKSEALEGNRGTDSVSSLQESSFENTLAFVTDERVSSLPIETRVQTPPRSKWTTQAHWERDWDITGEYLGTDKTLEEVGRKHSLVAERIRQVVKKGVRQLYQIQSTGVKSEFPFYQFGYRKPLPLSLRRRRSEARGGLSVRIEKEILEGKTIPQIKEGLDPGQISQVRRGLRGWGIEIPYEITPILPRYEKLRDPKLSDEEKQKLLDSVEHNSVLRVLSSGEEPLTMPVSKIGQEAGLFFRGEKVNFIYTVLRSKGLPASSFSQFVRYRKGNREKRRLTYYFICASDRDRAIEIIKSASEFNQLRINPVTILGKATDRIPREGELVNSGNYSHLGPLVIVIRGKSLSHIKVEDIILDDCPASVFRLGSKQQTFYRLDQEEQLRKYLKKRLRDIGLV